MLSWSWAHGSQCVWPQGWARLTGNAAWARRPEQGGCPQRNRALGWAGRKGPPLGDGRGRGKGGLGRVLQIRTPLWQCHFLRRTRSCREAALTRACVRAEEPLGDLTGRLCAWTSRLPPANARVVGGLPLASARTQTTLLLKLGPAFRRSLPAGPSPRGPRPAACDPRRCAPRPGCCRHLSHCMVTNDRRTVKTGAGRL